MALKDLLEKERGAILKKWFDLILATYPADRASSMGKRENQFTNPVGHTISREIERLFEKLLGNAKAEEFTGPLDSILKIRSVQDFAPSEAVGFVFLLKNTIVEILKDRGLKGPVLEEWQGYQKRIDDLALQAFDIYMGCREKICEVRIHRAQAEKETAFRMMERMTYSKEKHRE